MILYARWPFSDPVPIWLWNPLAAPGVYAVLVMDADWSPRPIYFGTADELSGRPAVSAHPAFRSWAREAGSDVKLWVAAHRETDPVQRLLKQAALIQQYAPTCNLPAAEPVPPTTVQRDGAHQPSLSRQGFHR